MVYRNGVTDVLHVTYSEVKKPAVDCQQRAGLSITQGDLMAAYTASSTVGGCSNICERCETDSYRSAVLGRCLAEVENGPLPFSACSWLETSTEGTARLPRRERPSGAVVAPLRRVLRWRGGQLHDDSARCEAGPDAAGVSAGSKPDAITGAPRWRGRCCRDRQQQQLGDLVQEFSATPVVRPAAAPAAPIRVINKFPWLTDILSCWADISSGSGGKVILRVEHELLYQRSF